MDVKKYRFGTNDKYYTLAVSPMMRNAVRTVATEMSCSVQEASYRLIARGMQWYMLNVRTKAGVERDAEWTRSPGDERNTNDGRQRDTGIRHRAKFPPLRTRKLPPTDNVQGRKTSIPDDYFPGDLS